MQEAWPRLGWYVPGAHPCSCEDPTGQNDPIGHGYPDESNPVGDDDEDPRTQTYPPLHKPPVELEPSGCGEEAPSKQ